MEPSTVDDTPFSLDICYTVSARADADEMEVDLIEIITDLNLTAEVASEGTKSDKETTKFDYIS